MYCLIIPHQSIEDKTELMQNIMDNIKSMTYRRKLIMIFRNKRGDDIYNQKIIPITAQIFF
jgi:hypothetical protein